MTKIIRNDSKGYGYSYASLCDIASQGVEIPLMKTGTDANGKDYIYFFEPQMHEWLRGAEIVIPESKGQNKAQMYASGVTYARRITLQMYGCVATTDDEVIENTNGDGTEKKEEKKKPKEAPKKDAPDSGEPSTEAQKQTILKMADVNTLKGIFKYYNVEHIEEMTKAQAIDCIKKLRAKEERSGVNG